MFEIDKSSLANNLTRHVCNIPFFLCKPYPFYYWNDCFNGGKRWKGPNKQAYKMHFLCIPLFLLVLCVHMYNPTLIQANLLYCIQHNRRSRPYTPPPSPFVHLYNRHELFYKRPDAQQREREDEALTVLYARLLAAARGSGRGGLHHHQLNRDIGEFFLWSINVYIIYLMRFSFLLENSREERGR